MSKLKYWREKEKLSKLLQVLVKQMYSVNESILCWFFVFSILSFIIFFIKPNNSVKASIFNALLVTHKKILHQTAYPQHEIKPSNIIYKPKPN